MSDSPTHFSLQVTGLERLQWKSNASGRYFKVAIGNRTMTGSISERDPAVGEDIVTFATSDMSASLEIRIKEARRRPFQNRVIGCVKITVAELLKECTTGGARIDLTPVQSAGPGGVIYLHLEVINAIKRAEIDVRNAGESIERIKRSAEAADSDANAIGSTVQKLDEIIKAVDEVVKADIYLNLAWQVTIALYKVISHQFKNDKKLVDLVHIMEEAFEFAQDTINLKANTEKLENLTNELLNDALDCSLFVRNYTDQKFLKRMVDTSNEQKMDDYKERFAELKRRLNSAIGFHSASRTEDIHLRQRLGWLKEQLNPTISDTSERPRCLSETRAQYIGQIKEWMFSGTKENIFWLKGIAGAGKSTIAASIRDYWNGEKRLAAYLFFERGKVDHSSIIRSIAYQFATFDRSLAQHIIEAVEKNKNFHGDTPDKQFEELLLKPLKAAADAVKGPVIIILDALDECGTVEQRRGILKLLSTNFADLPVQFRILVTSRPEHDIMNSLSLRPHILGVRLDHASEESRRDVDTYIDMELREIILDTPDDWADMMKALSDAANGLFIWASTMIKMVRISDDPIDMLQELVRDVRSVGIFGIDDLYATVLQQSGILWHDSKSRDRFIGVLGLILFSKESLTSEDVDGILGLEASKSRLTLQRLRSVIFYEPGKPIRLHHASFGDYLTSYERSGCDPWAINAQGRKEAIAAQCFNIMGDLLRFNICHVESSFICNDCVPELEERIKENIPPRLSYACRFWAEHLCDAPYSPDLSNKLTGFVYNRLLYWFEVLSLTGHFNRIASRSLYNVFMWTPPKDEAMLSFLWAAYRLASVFALPMSQSAPHIYLSVLSLWRDESAVADHYSRTHPTVRVHVLGTKPQSPCIKVLKGHKASIYSVAVSPDGKHIASGSHDGTVRIWDAESGELVLDPLKGHTGFVWSVAFSTDSRLVVSGSYDRSVRVWSTESGDLVLGPFEGHTGHVHTVAFSPDGKRIASGSRDRSIRVWDVVSGQLVLGPLEGHTDTVYSVAFSPDGERIVSGSADKSVRVWNAKNGTSVSGPFLGHEYNVFSVAVSPDGNRVASGSADGTIRVWDMDSGMPGFGPLEGHTDEVVSVAFSPDGKRMVSGSWDATIRIWDAKSGHPISGPFKGHMHYVSSVAFFPDGKRVVSGSWDNTIRIWDVQRSVVTSDTFEGHKDSVRSVAFSVDGERVVSGSDDRTICVWDVKSGRLVSGPFEGHTKEVTSVAFSPDGRFVASGSGDNSIRIWNAETGEDVLLEGHTRSVSSVAFSPDGKCLVSGSYDETVRVWDVDSGKTILDPLKEHEGWVNSVAFSPDGTCILSGSDDRTIRVWDTDSGDIVLGPLQGHTGYVYSVAFSPDGQRIVSGSKDNTIRIWSAETGQAIAGPFEGHTDMVMSVAFSPGGKCIASGSWDRSVRVWDADSGQVVLGPFMGYMRGVRSVAFSPCGRYIVSGSDDPTIRIWNVGNGKDVLDVRGTSRSPCLSTGADSAAASARRATKIFHLQGGGMKMTLPEECTATNWRVLEDGWIRGDQGELLIWIPEDMRATLWHPCISAILNYQFVMGLDFEGSPLGKAWCNGFSRPHSDIDESLPRIEEIVELPQDVALNSPPEISRDDAGGIVSGNIEVARQNQEAAFNFLTVIVPILQRLPYLLYAVVCSLVDFIHDLLCS